MGHPSSCCQCRARSGEIVPTALILVHPRLGGRRVYRLFIDEVGNDSLASSKDPKEQYLCLLGVVLDLDYADGQFTKCMNALKFAVFGTTEVVLHRREMMKKEPAPYDLLKDPEVQSLCDERIMEIVTQACYTAIAVMIDKKALVEQYPKQVNPYHYCLMALIERYINWLKERGAVGDVMAESRTKKANKKLSGAYRYLYKHGTRAWSSTKLVHSPSEVQKHLTSGEIKLKGKDSNVAGLQLADILASPARRDLICRKEGVEMNECFGKGIVQELRKTKYRRSTWPPYKLEGYGTKILP